MSICTWNVCCLWWWKTKYPSVIYLFTLSLYILHSVAYSLLLFGLFSSLQPSFLPLNLDLFSFPFPPLWNPHPSIFPPFLCLSPSTVISPVEGQWLEWGPWSRCSVTCSTGTQQRQRRCSSSVHGWAECKGLHQESRECTNPSCSGTRRKSMLCIHGHMLSNAIMQTAKNALFEGFCMVSCDSCSAY